MFSGQFLSTNHVNLFIEGKVITITNLEVPHTNIAWIANSMFAKYDKINTESSYTLSLIGYGLKITGLLEFFGQAINRAHGEDITRDC